VLPVGLAAVLEDGVVAGEWDALLEELQPQATTSSNETMAAPRTRTA